MNARLPLALAAGALLLAGQAIAQAPVERTLKLAPGGEFSLETDLGGVAVRGSAEADARVVVISRHEEVNELLTLRFEEHPGSVRVVARKKHLFSWFDFGRKVEFEVRVPFDTRVSVDTSGGAIRLSGLRSRAKLETSGGPIDVEDLSGDLDAHTSGGGIHLSKIEGRAHVDTSGGGIYGKDLSGPVRAETSGGRVELLRVRGDIHAHSSGGGIRIEQAGGKVEADTSGGGIDASFAKGNSHGGTLESSGGGVAVSLDPEANLEIEASGTSVHSDVPIRVQGDISRGRLRGTLGRGGEVLRVHTSGGGVRIGTL